MKVYILRYISSDSIGSEIFGVFSSRESAEVYANKNLNLYMGEYSIEDYEVKT